MQKLLRMDDCHAPSAMGLAGPALGWSQAVRLLRQFVAMVNAWAVRNGTRRALAELDRHQLADIGKTRAQAQHESAKPFWLA
jgi:uncharacterized protein YjiS (DUF1127 family)